MAWTPWARKPTVAESSGVVGIELSSSKARAVFAPSGGVVPRTLPLDDPDDDLPLTINLANRYAEIGRTGLKIRRALPHALCQAYLPQLGRPKEWKAGRHKLDASAAFSLVAEKLRPTLAVGSALALTLPPYLTLAQVTLLTGVLEQSRWPVLGTASLPLALAATAIGEAWSTALVVDVDDYAMSIGLLTCHAGQVRLLSTSHYPELGWNAWLDRLINAVADRCVRQCRRDPRDSAAAEQSLMEQLEASLIPARRGLPAEIALRTVHWFQTLVMTARELEQIVAPMARQAAESLRQAQTLAHQKQPAMAAPDMMWITHSASQLPGLVSACAAQLPERALLRELPADDPARAAHALACRWVRGDLQRGHLDNAAQLPVSGRDRVRVDAVPS